MSSSETYRDENTTSASSTVVDDDSYVCSMSTDVDLTLRGDLAASVQDYLTQIVAELHLVSRWTVECCRRLKVCQGCQAQRTSAVDEDNTCKPQSTSQRLLFQTDLELMRQEISRTQQNHFHRCTSEFMYTQNSIRMEHENRMNEHRQQLEDKIRHFSHETAAIMMANQSDYEVKVGSVKTNIRQLQQQLVEDRDKIANLEAAMSASIATLSTTQNTLESDINGIHRRIEKLESHGIKQHQELRSTTEDSMQRLRAGQTQLASKLQVLRLEFHENTEEVQRKIQQVHKILNRVASTDASSKIPMIATASPISAQDNSCPVTTKRIVRPSTEVSEGQESKARTTLSGVVMSTGSTAMATPDCFLYAKAALPHKDASINSWSPSQPKRSFYGEDTPRNYAMSMESSRDIAQRKSTQYGRMEKEHSEADDVEKVLVIQSSVLSQPLGRENESAEESSPLPCSSIASSVVQQPQVQNTNEYILGNSSTISTISAVAPTSMDTKVSIPITPPIVTVSSPRKFQASRLSLCTTHSSPRAAPQRPLSGKRYSY